MSLKIATTTLAVTLCCMVRQRRADACDGSWHSGRVSGIRIACATYLRFAPDQRKVFSSICREYLSKTPR